MKECSNSTRYTVDEWRFNGHGSPLRYHHSPIGLSPRHCVLCMCFFVSSWCCVCMYVCVCACAHVYFQISCIVFLCVSCNGCFEEKRDRKSRCDSLFINLTSVMPHMHTDTQISAYCFSLFSILHFSRFFC